MDTSRFLEFVKKLDSREERKNEEFERLKRFFERFHILNRNYLDRETFEKAKDSISSIAQEIVNTLNFLDSEIARLRSKRIKLPFENVKLGEMQKIQKRNEILLKEYMSGLDKNLL